MPPPLCEYPDCRLHQIPRTGPFHFRINCRRLNVDLIKSHLTFRTMYRGNFIVFKSLERVQINMYKRIDNISFRHSFRSLMRNNDVQIRGDCKMSVYMDAHYLTFLRVLREQDDIERIVLLDKQAFDINKYCRVHQAEREKFKRDAYEEKSGGICDNGRDDTCSDFILWNGDLYM